MISLVEPLKAVAWPMAAIVIACVFRGDIRSLLPRLRKAGLSGIELDAVQQQQQQSASGAVPSDKLPLKPVIEQSTRPAVNMIESGLRGELENIDDSKRIPILLRALSIAQLERGHESTYNRIFGSQIVALTRINQRTDMSIIDLRSFLQPYENQFPQLYSTYTFDSWLRFMVAGNLVVQSNDLITLSDFGRDFLLYIIEHRLSELKPF